MVTILDALLNAQINFKTIGKIGLSSNPIYLITSDQLNNAIQALENGKGIYDEIEISGSAA